MHLATHLLYQKYLVVDLLEFVECFAPLAGAQMKMGRRYNWGHEKEVLERYYEVGTDMCLVVVEVVGAAVERCIYYYSKTSSGTMFAQLYSLVMTSLRIAG